MVMDAIPVRNAWEYCPRCGVATTLHGKHPFRCSDCSYTHYFSPNTAVGALIVDDTGAMLLIVRGRDPGKGKLALPGGFVDAGETAEAALIREIGEEVNLEVSDYDYLASFPNEYAFRGIVTPVTDLFYVANVSTLQGIASEAGEIEGWKFVRPAEFASVDLAFDTHRLALEAYTRTHVKTCT